jgi:squalene-associated FAD-dependent desaturase
VTGTGPPGERARGRVAVVGGGLAGIAAALDCADAGATVALLEVRPRLGGAAYSFERDGLLLDNGQHVFLRCCTEYRALLDRLGATGRTVLQERLDIPVLAPGRRAGRLRRNGLPAPLHLAGSLARYPHMAPRERLGAVRAALALGRLDPDDPALDGVTFGDWLGEHGQGEAAVTALWDLIGIPTLNLPAAEASLAQAAFVFRTGLLRSRDAGDVGYARVPLARVHDEPARAALSRAGVDVRLGWRAERIETSGRAVQGVASADGELLEADAVVLAVPHERAARLLPPGALADNGALAGLGVSPIVNLHVHFDRRVTELPMAAAVRSPVQWFFDRTEASGAERGQLLAVSLSAAREQAAMGVAELEARYVPALAELLPGACGARVERFVVTREHAATFRAAPGARALRPGAATGVEGLALAGAWTDTGWPATMEGAVRSGRAAARVALAAIARARPPLEAVA